MPLQPSKRAEACSLLGRAYELAQEALLAGNSADQSDRWEEVLRATADAHGAVIRASLEMRERGRR